MEQILKQRVDVDKQCVGIAVGIIEPQGNQTVAYGTLRASKTPTKPDANTVFEIGSVTKVFHHFDTGGHGATRRSFTG